MTVSVANTESMERAERLLAGIEGGVTQALKTALKQTTSQIRKNSYAAIQTRYDISEKDIRSEENVRVWYTTASGVQAHVRFAGQKIPLYRFGGTSPKSPSWELDKQNPVMVAADRWRLAFPGSPVHAHQLKGTAPSLIYNAFIAEMSSGHVGIFERAGGRTYKGAGKEKLSEKMGSSVPQMIGNDEVMEQLTKDAVTEFGDRLDDAILAVLSR